MLGEVAAGSLVAVPLDTDELVRPLGIIHRRGKQLGGTAERFIELLQREAKNLLSEGGKTRPGIELADDEPEPEPAHAARGVHAGDNVLA